MNSTLNQVPRASTATPQGVLLPLALAQFICSYAASNMNVAISNIATDLGTTVSGVQTTIAVFNFRQKFTLKNRTGVVFESADDS